MFDWFKTYDSLDEIDEDKRGAFVEKDGKFAVVKALDKTALQNTLDANKKTIKEQKDALKRFADLDLDDDKIASLHDDLEELEELRKGKDLDPNSKDYQKKIDEAVASKLEAVTKKFEREIAKRDKDIATKDEILGKTNKSLSKATLERVVIDKAVEKGVQKHSLKSALRFASDDFTVNEEGEIVDKTDAGRSIEDWLDEYVTENPQATIDLKNAGTGSLGGDGKGGGNNRITMEQFNKMPPAKQDEIAEKAGKGELTLVD